MCGSARVVNIARLAGCPGLPRVRELTVAQLFLTDETVLALLFSPHLSGLRAGYTLSAAG